MNKTILIFLSFFILNPAWGSYAELSSDDSLILKSRVTDVYKWSTENEQYNLSRSEFSFKIWSTVDRSSRLLDEGQANETAKEGVRSMSVFSDKVYFEDSSSGKTTSIPARVSEDETKLAVYFSNENKMSVLNTLLAGAGVEFPKQRRQNVSDYNCQIENNLLICSMDYVLTASQ